MGGEDPLEKGKATPSSIPAWRTFLYSPWSYKESDTTERLSLSFFFSGLKQHIYYLIVLKVKVQT